MRGALFLLVTLTFLIAPLAALPEEEWQSANQAYQNQSYRPAMEAYRRFLRQAKPADTRRQQAFLQVARCLEKLKEPEREREWLDEWLAKAPPGLPAARGWLMRSELEQDQVRRRSCYARVIAMLENRSDGLSELVQAYIARAGCRGPSAEVERDLRAALALDPSARYSAQAFLDLANYYRHQQDSPIRALEILYELVMLRPDAPEAAEALLEEARILDELERYPEALETLEQLLANHSSTPAAREGAELRDEIRDPRLELTGDMLTSSEESVLSLRARNVEQVELAVYRVDLVRILREEGTLEPARLPVSGQPLTEQTLPIQPRAPHAPYEARLPVPLERPGAYLVQARSGGRTAAALLVRSNLRFFQGGDGLLWLVDTRTGRPLSRAELWQALLGEKKGYERVRTMALLEGGLVPLEMAARPGLVLARVQEEYAWAEVAGSKGPGKEGFVFTDRPLYRPGQKVRYQAILRTRLGGDALRVPAGEPFRVLLLDPRGNRLLDLNREAGSDGVISGEVTLAGEAAHGPYRLELLQAGFRCAGGVFRVDEFRGEPELVVEPAKSHYQDGQTAELTVLARDLTGQPVAQGQLIWRAYRREILPSELGRPGLDWFQPSGRPDRGGALAAQGQTRLDETGRARLRFPIRLDQPLPDELYRYTLEAEVTDRARKTIFGRGSLLASTRSVFLKVRSQRFFWFPGSQVDLEAEAVDVLGRPVTLSADWILSRRVESGRFEKVTSGQVELKEGRGRFQCKPEQPGFYRIELQARDQGGQPIRTAGTFQVGEEGRLFQSAGVQVLSDRDFYEVGDLAELVITTSQPATDVLLILGDSRRMVVHCPEKLTRLQVPIGADLAPLFSLRAVAMQNGSWLEYEREVQVANTPGVLRVALQPAPDQKPDEVGLLDLSVSDSRGAAVAGAEVTVSVTDASVYQSTQESPESLVRAFFGLGPQRPAPRARPAPPPREILLDTPLFTTVRTGPDGKASVKVVYPDTLTTWKVVARAFTSDSRFGQAEAEVGVSKDLLVRLEAPLFLVERDECAVAVRVQNNRDDSQQAEVSLRSEGGSPETSPARQLSVAGNSSKGTDFSVSVAREGWLLLTAMARTSSEVDSSKRKLPILPHGTIVQLFQAGSLRRQTAVELRVPAERNPSSTRLEVRLSTTLAGPALAALEQLLDHPYGCVEQTVSRFVPAACLARAVKDLELPENELVRQVPSIVQIGLSRLASFQHSDGGWGWWKDDPTDSLMTAYVVYGLTLARQSGYQVSDSMLSRARNHLRRKLERMEPAEAAWALLALSVSEQAPEAELERIYQGRERLPATELFVLSLAMHHQGRNEEARSLLHGQVISEDVETNATALMAYNAVAPDDPAVAGLIRWLLEHREGGGWGTTRATALSLLALVEPLRREKNTAPLRYGLFLNGSEVDTRTVAPEDWWKEQITRLKGEQVPAGDLKLEIVTRGDVTGSWSTMLRYATREENLAPSGDSLKIARRYYRLAEGRSEALRSGKAVRSKDEIVVVLDLESSSALDYLVLEDFRPAGCSVVGLTSGLPYADGLCSNVEVRDELTSFFIAHLKPGKSQLSYRMKAETPGRFHALPARLYAMYAPRLRATSGEQRLEVLP